VLAAPSPTTLGTPKRPAHLPELAGMAMAPEPAGQKGRQPRTAFLHRWADVPAPAMLALACATGQSATLLIGRWRAAKPGAHPRRCL